MKVPLRAKPAGSVDDGKFLPLVDLAENELAGLERRPTRLSIVAALGDLSATDGKGRASAARTNWPRNTGSLMPSVKPKCSIGSGTMAPSGPGAMSAANPAISPSRRHHGP